MGIPIPPFEVVARWATDPLAFVCEALFGYPVADWRPWEPGSPIDPKRQPGPELWQGKVLADVGRARTEGRRRFTVRAGHGVGKGLAVEEPVLTPHGWRPIGEVSVGDLVASVDGTWTPVVGVFPQGVRPRYRVTLDDGSSVVTDDQHLWLTTTRSERKHGRPGRVRSTPEIAETLTFANGPREGLNHCLPALAAVQHPRAAVPVDPYVLGVWLGDGSKSGRVATNASDVDIVAACGAGRVAVDRGTATFSSPGLVAGLRVLGLHGLGSHERFVPRCYLHASVSQRVALLQGLLDTDGTVGRNNAVTFDTSSVALADGVAELVRSLGGVARRSGRQGRYRGEAKRWSYRVYVALPADIAPFRCARKAGAYRPAFGDRNRDRTLRRFVKSVERIEDGETVCIAVAHPSKLYVTRDHIVTHNTTIEAWLILWFVLFHRPVKAPVTANSQDQLRDVVWAEVAAWWRRLPEFLRAQIEVRAERVEVRARTDDCFAVARTARPEKPEALQGFHSDTLAFFIEEASGIEDVIFEVASGALSSPDSWVFMFANPTRISGYFYRSHHQNREQWRCYHVPCSHSSRVDPSYAAQIAAEYGEHSNVYRVRVLGEFPTTEDDAVISLDIVESAVGRHVADSDRSTVWGLDVARFGDDSTALAKRRGSALLEPVKEWRKLDLMQTVGRVAREYDETPVGDRPGSINVDVIGLGGGVVDRLRELGYPVRGINVGEAAPTDPARYMRQRDELWFKARDWFVSMAVRLPKDDGLIAELVQPKYRLESSGKIKVESKDEMKKRGFRSPNKADAFCLTFAGGDYAGSVHRPVLATVDYDPFAVGTPDFVRDEERRGNRQATSGIDDYRPW